MPRWHLIVVLLLVSTLGTGCGGQMPERESPATRVVGPRYGLSVSVPDGWEARLSRGALVAATFSLPPPGSIGLREMAFAELEEDDMRLLLFEDARENRSPPTDVDEYPQLTGELRLDEGDFGSEDGNSADSATTGHGFARRTFQMSGRLFVAFVESGSRPPATEGLGELNELLRSLDVAPGDFYPGTVEPARFPERSGWHTGTSGRDEVDADGEFTTAWAATIPYADEWNALPPFRTLERLPGDGIVIWLGLSRTNRFPPPKLIRDAPFRIDTFERVYPWEGQVRDIPEYRLWGTVEDETNLDLRIYFGRSGPTPALLEDAQAMLDDLRLPDWGPFELEP